MAQDKSQASALDMVYIGDDGSKEGNDYPAFKAVGFRHSVLVAQGFLADYDPGLGSGYVGGLLQGTRNYGIDFYQAVFKEIFFLSIVVTLYIAITYIIS